MQAELKAGGRRGRRALLGVCREAAALGAAGSRAAELEPALVLGLEAADAKTRQLGFELAALVGGSGGRGWGAALYQRLRAELTPSPLKGEREQELKVAVLVAAYDALGMVSGPVAAAALKDGETLLMAMTHSDPRVRAAAVEAVGNLVARNQLHLLLGSADEPQQKAATLAEIVFQLIADPAPNVSCSALGSAAALLDFAAAGDGRGGQVLGGLFRALDALVVGLKPDDALQAMLRCPVGLQADAVRPVVRLVTYGATARHGRSRDRRDLDPVEALVRALFAQIAPSQPVALAYEAACGLLEVARLRVGNNGWVPPAIEALALAAKQLQGAGFHQQCAERVCEALGLVPAPQRLYYAKDAMALVAQHVADGRVRRRCLAGVADALVRCALGGAAHGLDEFFAMESVVQAFDPAGPKHVVAHEFCIALLRRLLAEEPRGAAVPVACDALRHCCRCFEWRDPLLVPQGRAGAFLAEQKAAAPVPVFVALALRLHRAAEAAGSPPEDAGRRGLRDVLLRLLADWDAFGAGAQVSARVSLRGRAGRAGASAAAAGAPRRGS